MSYVKYYEHSGCGTSYTNIIFITTGQFDHTGDRLCGLNGSNTSTHLISLRVSLYMQKIRFESLVCSRSMAKHHWMK